MSDEPTPDTNAPVPAEPPTESPFTPPPLDLVERGYGPSYPAESDDRD